MEKISVIIPIYNVENYLESCIESVLGQTYPCMELILIDDGSTDKSAQICDNYCRKDPRIRCLHTQNEGASSARNKGLELAVGEIISFVDGDDLIHPEMYNYLYGKMKETQASLAVCSFQTFYEIGDISNGGEQIQTVETVLDFASAVKMLHSESRNDLISPCCKIYRKELFSEGLRYPEGRYREDEYIVYKVLFKAGRIFYTDKQLYYYLQRESSSMHTPCLKRETDYYDALIERHAFFKECNLDKELLMEDTYFCINQLCNYLFQNYEIQETKKYYRKAYVAIYDEYTSKRINYKHMAVRYCPGLVEKVRNLKKQIEIPKRRNWSNG